MLTWDELKNAKLGQSFDSKDLKRYCDAVYGGVAWPNKRLGFAAVVARNRFEQYGTREHEIYLLDECESREIDKLVRWYGGADLKYSPNVWVGDRNNKTADQIVREYNSETMGHSLSLSRTSLLDMSQPYQYILQNLRRLLREDNRTLFLKDSRIRDYLMEITEDAEIELELGDYPAIEALAFAVLEKRNRRRGCLSDREQLEQARALSKKYKKCY